MPTSPSPVNGPAIRTTNIDQLSNHTSDDSTTTEPSTPIEIAAPITENPFDSPESKPLFEAIDQLQSCQINQHIEIPQLVIVGDQSSGKSSLLQSLTDIPFPVGVGCCTRFATRIVSKRTASGTANQFKITIVDPEVRISGFEHNVDDGALYQSFERVGETLSSEEFKKVIEEVSSEYLGIKRGRGPGTKNFATQVLRIELSGPSRSHFSILDIPGHISNSTNMNDGDMKGVENMIKQYMKQRENIVICVADAIIDLERHSVVHLASRYVTQDRLVKVFTKCDGVSITDKPRVVKHATTALGGNWFIVRNRHGEEDRFFDLSAAEDRLFNEAPWSEIAPDHRGTSKLRRYLSNFLCRRIRSTFPQLQDKIRELLNGALEDRRVMGDPRRTNKDKQLFLRDIIRRYESHVHQGLEEPWKLESHVMMVRVKVNDLNRTFSQEMHDNGHTYPFEHIESRGEAGTVLYDKIRAELGVFQSTQLPGLPNPQIVPHLFQKQTDKWHTLAEHHLREVADSVAQASKAMLSSVCQDINSTSPALYLQLYRAVETRFNDAFDRAREDIRLYCDKERTHLPQTTDDGFYNKVKAMQALRRKRSLEALRARVNDWTAEVVEAFYEGHYSSAEDNVVNEIHDILRVYYEDSVSSFIAHITTIIVEDFVSNPTGSLRSLSQDWINGLSDNEVACFASEDVDTVARREYLDNHIAKLQEAHEIAKKAWTIHSA